MAAKKKRARKRTVHHVRTRSIDPALIAEMGKLFAEYQKDREQKRLEVFERAWASLPRDSAPADPMRVALAVAYLGGSK